MPFQLTQIGDALAALLECVERLHARVDALEQHKALPEPRVVNVAVVTDASGETHVRVD